MTTKTSRLRRSVAASTMGLVLLAMTACGTTTDTSASAAETTSVASSAASDESADTATSTETGATTSAASTSTESPTLEEMVAAGVADGFDQVEWTDPETGTTLTYNIYLPADYDESSSYPMVVYIPDSSLVGDDATAALSQYGALVWASEAMQAEAETIVVVPSYPEVILDDHGSFTMTDYVDMTARLVESLETTYAVDANRVYGTGQSMGAMTIMYLAAQDPDLFAAEMIVSGQWDITQLTGLADETFVYTAAAGDDKASVGQTDVEAMLDDAGVAYGTTTADATDAEATEAAAEQMLAAGDSANFLTFDEGTVLEASGSDGGMGGEHMASFQPAYEISALRTWLLQQTAA